MADHKHDGSRGFDPVEDSEDRVSGGEPEEAGFIYSAPEEDGEAPQVSPSEEAGYLLTDIDNDDFEAPDVSMPRETRKEIEIIEEALAMRRRDWIKSHMIYIYAVIGVIVVALTVGVIYMFYQNTNPMTRLVNAASKDFGTSFDFTVKMTENDEAVMSYEGSIAVDRSKHEIEAYCEADYNRYAFITALIADDDAAVKGSYYNKKWTLQDCHDQVQDFFDFDRSLRSGSFNGGAFLRFTELTSDYSTSELETMAAVLKERLSTESTVATITTTETDEGTSYDYDIDLDVVFSYIQKNGASLFYRATDYDRFSATYEANRHIVEASDCHMRFFIDSSGYLSTFEIAVTTEGQNYGLLCEMSDFGAAEVELPQSFLKATVLDEIQE